MSDPIKLIAGATAMQISDTLGITEDITGATVQIKLRPKDGRPARLCAAMLISASAKTVRSAFVEADYVAGEYTFSWIVTLSNGKVAYVPSDGYGELIILPN